MSYITTRFEQSIQSDNRLGIGNPKTIQILGYIRTSQAKPNNEPSHELQETRIQEYVSIKGYQLKMIYFDESDAKSLEGQPQLQKLLTDLQRRHWDRNPEMVVTYSLSRLSRNIRNAYEILDQIRHKHSDLICLDIDLDLTTPLGKLMFNTKLSISQFEEQCEQIRDGEAELKTMDLV